MKITKPDYERLNTLILTTVTKNKINKKSDYEITQTRYLWDIYHSTVDYCMINNVQDYFFIRRLYDYMKDDHLETALKNILKDYLQ